MLRPTQSQPAPPQPSTGHQTEKTLINGSITAQGPVGVDSVETPFGRYHRKLSNLIRSRWLLYMQEHPKDVGDVAILVKIDPSGKVSSTRVINNDALDDLAELSIRAIMDSNLPPVPDDLAPMLKDGKLEIPFYFDVYDSTNDSPGR
jgi:outer membrane biosynthesis protein TonB